MSSIINLGKTDECLDLSDQAKEKIFMNYNKLFREYLTDVIYAKNQTKDPYLLKVNATNLKDKGICTIYQNNHSDQVNEASLCPWVNKIKYRNNKIFGYKYPEIRIEAHCVCDKCDSTFNSSYGCVPILKPDTCLERSTICGPDGYWRWIPSVEMVNVACACILVN